MLRISSLNDLLANFLNEVPDLLAALVVDIEGLIIAQQSVKGFDEEIIGAIMSLIEQTIQKIRKVAVTSFGSGTFDTNEFRLFYVELGGVTQALFVIVADPYSNIENFIPYSYIIAEKISMVLDNREISLNIPKLSKEGELIFESENDNTNMIIILGSPAVGKSALIETYINGCFDQKYKPTLGISIIKKELQIARNINSLLYLFDTGGLKSFAKIRKFYYQNPSAVLIMFDYTNNDSLENTDEWIEEARHFIRNLNIPFVLIGNKTDLAEHREDLRIKAQSLATQYKMKLFETSALTGEGIDELFTYLISNLLHYNK